jgi:hypothetical protein
MDGLSERNEEDKTQKKYHTLMITLHSQNLTNLPFHAAATITTLLNRFLNQRCAQIIQIIETLIFHVHHHDSQQTETGEG